MIKKRKIQFKLLAQKKSKSINLFKKYKKKANKKMNRMLYQIAKGQVSINMSNNYKLSLSKISEQEKCKIKKKEIYGIYLKKVTTKTLCMFLE